MKNPDISIFAKEKILDYLEEDADFDAAKYIGEYDEKYVFSCCRSDGVMPYVGSPRFFLLMEMKSKLWSIQIFGMKNF